MTWESSLGGELKASRLTHKPARGDRSLLTGEGCAMPHEGKSSLIPAIHVVARVSRAFAICLAVSAPVVLQASPARAANSCRMQCAAVGKACRLPFQVAYQTQRAGCTGVGKRLCIVAAKIMYSAGRTLCRSVVTNCRRCCQGGRRLCAATCGDGIVGENEDCDPPGWASCPGGAACGADCTCP